MKSQTIKLTIDGTEVEVNRGATILEAAQAAGIRIPTLCHDRRLIPFGACRLCVVQQKGKSELLPSCFTPAKEGMEILTRSPEVIESRRLQLQLILLNHPMICPRCEKEGECNLQTLVYEYGVEETIYPWERISFPVDDTSPLLQRDPNKCILCGRCVRICDELQGVGELSFTHRGTKSVIDTDFHRPIHCEFCGQCMDTCPVGAITSNRFDYSVKTWEWKETTTPCPYCGCGCLLTIGSKEGEIKRVFSDAEKGPNDGNLCVKGRFGWDVVDHPERIKSPLLRMNGNLKEVSWDEALRFVVRELEAIKEENGPQSIGAMASSRLTNEEIYLFQKLFRESIGTNSVDLGDPGEKAARALQKILGWPASTSAIQEIRNADCILLVGTDPAQTHPIIKNEIHLAIRRNKAQLIVLGNCDIRLSGSTQLSPLLPPSILLLEKPGMEVSVVNAMIQTILRENLEDKDFIEAKTEGLDGLREQQLKMEAEAKVEVKQAARAFAQAKRAMILIGSGAWVPFDQKEVAIASSNLCLVTGHIGKPSSGILLLHEKCNSQGAIDIGTLFEDDREEERDLLKDAAEGKLKALYLVGRNLPLPSFASGDQALEKLRLLVVQDLFMTETAKRARVVLPASAFVEKRGTYTNLERRIQELIPLRPPLAQSKPDFEIFLQLLSLFESPLVGKTPEAIFQEIGQHLPHYRGLCDGEQWPKGHKFLYENGFPTGRVRLIPLETKGFQPQPYPFHLIQRPSLFQSGLLSSKSDALNRVTEKPFLEMHPDDAQALHIEEGEFLQITTRSGKSMGMNVKLSSRLLPGIVTAPYPCPIISEGVESAKVERMKETK
ncbi:MAG: molybdopterin-dependent oxidoreductase [Thermodesulfobacteriota bacterium]